MPTFYEFFAGGGLARAGIGSGWDCVFANDFDPIKTAIYRQNWGADHLHQMDIAKLTPADLPGEADLAWASFPCQDVSLAGNYAGLEGKRSGTFWIFWKLMRQLAEEGRGPKIIALENVYGVLTSNDGLDFQAIASAFAAANYQFGAVIIDACHFLPQSRPRFFLLAVRPDVPLPDRLRADGPHFVWHPPRLVEAYTQLSEPAKRNWVWWDLPTPSDTVLPLKSVIEEEPTLVEWHTPAETRKLLDMMSDLNAGKVRRAQRLPGVHVGTVYKRTRKDVAGKKVQRAEIRFDAVAGCLRTPEGGSSRQIIVVVEGERIRSRLLSPREAARLMGLPDSYELPTNYNEGYKLAGDGVAVPVVAHLRRYLFNPVIRAFEAPARQAV